MKTRKIRTTPSVGKNLKISGELKGKDTYLLLADGTGRGLGVIEGQKLYRLAKAIVRRFETARTATRVLLTPTVTVDSWDNW